MFDDLSESDGLTRELRETWRRLRAFAALCGAMGACVALFAGLVACLEPKTLADPKVAAYVAESAACVDQASTRAESTRCRAAVNAKYGVFQDGGP